MPKLLIADDHPLFARALTMAASAADPDAEVVTAATLADAQASARESAIDLVLLDYVLPDVDGFAGLLLLRSLLPATSIAIVSSRDEPGLMRQAARLGARGFISKSSSTEQTIAAIRVLLAGGQWFADDVLTMDATPADADAASGRIDELSAAQLRVLQSVASGRQNKQIAHDLGLTEPTIKSHLVTIYRKLGVANRMQAVLAFQSSDH